MPNKDEFKRQVLDFKERIADTRVGDAFDKNLMAESRVAEKTKPISIDLGNQNKMVFGVKREDNDIEGNKF